MRAAKNHWAAYLACVILAGLGSYVLSLREFVFDFYIDPYTYINMATRVDVDAYESIGIREPLFPLFLFMVGFFTKNNVVAFMAVQFLGLLSLMTIARRFDDRVLSTISRSIVILTVPAIFVLYSNLWRQLFSIIIVLLAFNYGGRAKFSSLLMAVGVLTHFSAALLVAGYVLDVVSRHRSRYFMLLLVCAGVALASHLLRGYSFLQEYDGQGEGTLLRRAYLAATMVFLLVYSRRHHLYSCALLTSFLILSIVPNPLFDRFSHIAIFLNFFVIVQSLRSITSWVVMLCVVVGNAYLLMQTQTAQRMFVAFLLS